MQDWNEGDEQAGLLSMLPEAWIKRVTKEEAKRAKLDYTFKMMLPREYHPNVLAWTKKHVAQEVKRRELRNALLITVTGDRGKTAMLRLDESDVGRQTLRLQAIPARMTCDEVLEWVGEEVLKEYKNLHHTRTLKAGHRDVNYVGEGSGGESAMDQAGTEAGEALDDEDDDDEPAETAVCAFVANNLNAGSHRGSSKPLQKGWSPCSQGPQLGRSQDAVAGSATPSHSGENEHEGIAAGGRPGLAPKMKDSRSGRAGTSEGTNPCTRPSFATKNVFDVLQDLSESIRGSRGPQLDAADEHTEPIVHELHQSLIELLERPEILSLHAVRRVGCERQLHLNVGALCGEVEKVFDVLVDMGAQVSLVKAGLLPPECLTDSRRPVRLKVANGQYMVGGTREAAFGLQFVNHRELSCLDVGKENLLQGRFYEAQMDWDMIVGYDLIMETDSSVLPAQASMTLYQDDQLSWLSSPEHHVKCQ